MPTFGATDPDPTQTGREVSGLPSTVGACPTATLPLGTASPATKPSTNSVHPFAVVQ